MLICVCKQLLTQTNQGSKKMARTAANLIVAFTINNQQVNAGDLIAYTLGKRTNSYGTFVKTAGPANVQVIDANGRNGGKPMYVHRELVTGFFTAPATIDEVVEDNVDEGAELIKYWTCKTPNVEYADKVKSNKKRGKRK